MMLLPTELRTLIFLAGLTTIRAQIENVSTEQATHSTAPDAPAFEVTDTLVAVSIPSGDTNDLAPSSIDPNSETPPESQPTDGVYPCYLANPPDWCEEEPPPFWHPEVSATGWDEWGEWNNDNIGGGGGQGFAPTTTVVRSTERPPIVITTSTPIVVEIKTSVESSASDVVGAVSPTRNAEPGPIDDDHTEQQDSPAQPTAAGQGAPQNEDSESSSTVQENPSQPTPVQSTPEVAADDLKPNDSRPQMVSTGNSLLDAIIGQMGKVEPGAQPVPALAPNTATSGRPISRESQDASTTGTASVEGGNIAEKAEGTQDTAAHDSIAVGDTITLGSATLTLTPGLSTILGTGSDTTLVAIQTNDASQTIIVVSSSGTAITATITNAPATVTVPRTGFEASVTNSAGRGVATPRLDATALITSSRGMASEKMAAVDGITGLLLGAFGLVLAS